MNWWSWPDRPLRDARNTRINASSASLFRRERMEAGKEVTERREWWLAKLNGNAARDKRHQAALRKLIPGTG